MGNMNGKGTRRQHSLEIKAKVALAAIKGSWSIPVPPEEVEKRLAEMPARERALENEALVLDGGLQNAVPVLTKWAGAEL